MARTKTERDSFQAEASKLARKLQGQGRNVLAADVSPDGEMLVFSMEFPDAPGAGFELQVPFLIDDGNGGFVTGEEYIRSSGLEGHIAGVVAFKSPSRRGLIVAAR